MARRPIIGVLALQGAVQPHKPHIEAAGAEFRAVKTAEDFDAVDAFILPGGESTTMLKLIDNFNLWDALARNFQTKPVWGICAGAILMAETVYKNSPLSLEGEGWGEGVKGSKPPHPGPLPSGERGQKAETQKSFGLLPITVQRNGYGRQLDSHQIDIDGYPVSFIRAPIILPPSQPSPHRGEGKVGGANNLQILATHQNTPVWIQKGQYMATTFHPELTLDFPSPMHRAFVRMIGESMGKQAA